MDYSEVKNPFLFDDPVPLTNEGGSIVNPFLSGEPLDFTATCNIINPFADDMNHSNASVADNIFGDSSQYPIAMNPFGEVCFAQEPVYSDPFSCAFDSSNIPERPPLPPIATSPVVDFLNDASPSSSVPCRPPPPRPPPPSKEMKDLLQTVIGAMEATTDTLQDKLNTTQSPCPSPNSGAHASRSPTPDIQVTAPEKEPDAFSAAFGQTIELSDQEMDIQASEPVNEVLTSSEVDLFGVPIVERPKTTQDILSLYNKPLDGTHTFDLLSGDLISEDINLNEDINERVEVAADAVIDVLESRFLEAEISVVPTKPNENNSEPLEATMSPEPVSEKSDSEPTVVEASVLSLPVNASNGISVADVSDTFYTEQAPLNKKESVNNELKDEVVLSKQGSTEEILAKEKSLEKSDEEIGPPPEEPQEPATDIITDDSEEFPPPPQFDSEATEATISDFNASVGTFDDSVVNSSIDKDKTLEQKPFGLSPELGDSENQNLTTVDLNSKQCSTADEHLTSDNIAVSSSIDIGSFFTNTSFSSTGTVPAKDMGSTIFGPPLNDAFESNVPPVPAGSASTGAVLFETTAPAPNVGMSLFGGGTEATLDIFAESESNAMVNPFALTASVPTMPIEAAVSNKLAIEEDFDAFSARFESAAVTEETEELAFDPFSAQNRASSPWGEAPVAATQESFGFGDNAQFDTFLSLNEPPPVPQSTPSRTQHQASADSDEGTMTVVIKPVTQDGISVSPRGTSPVPVLAPPPVNATSAFSDLTPRFNPFDKSAQDMSIADAIAASGAAPAELQRSDSQETPPTPLFEEDQSQPLEPFPRTEYVPMVWEMHLRQPNKKKITGQRFWKKVLVKLIDTGALQLYNNKDDKDPFQELPLQACYSVSDIGAQQFDQYGKVFTVKIQYIFYKERPGVRPGQISKAERITNKLSKFAQYAIAGDYEGVKEFASDVRKLGMPVEHAPQISQLLKLGAQNYEEVKLFAALIEEQLFKITIHRDRALNYKSEEVQLTAVDEMYVEHDIKGIITRMIARVRIFFLGFLSGMPEVDLGINDLKKQGREVVGRHDIIPVVTEEWIRLEDVEFHCCVNKEEFESTRHIKFKPPDACYIELMRFRVRPPKNRELPFQIKSKMIIQGRKVTIESEVLIPGFSGRKLGQVPCEDVAVRFPLPECWIYMFRVEKHFRYGSVKSAHRRTGKIKGLERLKGAVEQPESALMEVTSGQAKYEHQHRSVVWRMSRLPKEGQGAYTMHQFVCRINLTPYDQMPDILDKNVYVEFTMPATTVSHCVMRSVSVTSEDPPEKYVRYLARHEYRTEMEFASPTGPSSYITMTMKTEEQQQKKDAIPEAKKEEWSSEDSD